MRLGRFLVELRPFTGKRHAKDTSSFPAPAVLTSHHPCATIFGGGVQHACLGFPWSRGLSPAGMCAWPGTRYRPAPLPPPRGSEPRMWRTRPPHFRRRGTSFQYRAGVLVLGESAPQLHVRLPSQVRALTPSTGDLIDYFSFLSMNREAFGEIAAARGALLSPSRVNQWPQSLYCTGSGGAHDTSMGEWVGRCLAAFFGIPGFSRRQSCSCAGPRQTQERAVLWQFSLRRTAKRTLRTDFALVRTGHISACVSSQGTVGTLFYMAYESYVCRLCQVFLQVGVWESPRRKHDSSPGRRRREA